MPTAKPQDHRPKKADGFPFKVGTKTYKLPAMTEKAANAVPGDVTMDAVLEPDDATAQLRLALASLNAVGVSPAAMTALRTLPTGEMLEVVLSWLGEQGGSSSSSGTTEEPSSTTSEAGSE